MNEMHNVLIGGVGQLGYRYLQGALSNKQVAKVWLYETYHPRIVDLLSLPELSENVGKVKILDAIEQLPAAIDLAIISNNSVNRIELVESVEKHTHAKAWIVEKVLCQSLEHLGRFESFAKRQGTAWVNTFFRSVEMFADLKNRLKPRVPLKVNVSGGKWGLGCNSIHFIDFVEWLADDEVLSIDANGLDRNWQPAKRDGFFEVNGVLDVHYKSGSELIMQCDLSQDPFLIKVDDSVNVFTILWDEGIVESGTRVIAKQGIPYQSQMTPRWIDLLAEEKNLPLPSLSDSIRQHGFLLKAFQDSRRAAQAVDWRVVPIT